MNPLVELVENVLKRLDIRNAKLVRDSYYPENFGNAEAVYQLGNLGFYFVRDREQVFLSLSSQTCPENYYQFCDVSLMMGWESLDEIVNVDEPISMDKALRYINDNLRQLEKAFSENELESTRTNIKAAEQRRIRATFS